MKEENLKALYFFLLDTNFFDTNSRYKKNWQKDKKLFMIEVKKGKISWYDIDG